MRVNFILIIVLLTSCRVVEVGNNMSDSSKTRTPQDDAGGSIGGQDKSLKGQFFCDNARILNQDYEGRGRIDEKLRADCDPTQAFSIVKSEANNSLTYCCIHN